MKKFKLFSLFLVIAAMIGLTACQAETYTVTFDSVDGTVVEAITVTENGTITMPADPTKEGHVFDGWYLDAEYTNKIDEFYKVEGDITLYAKWSKETYTVSFVLNGGTGEAPEQKVEYNSAVQLPQAPTKEGHSFVGWYLNEALTTPYTNGKIKADTTLYAKYRSLFVYTGSLTGEATYNAEDGTYSLVVDLAQWNTISFYYNGALLSASDEDLILTGDIVSVYDEITVKELYQDLSAYEDSVWITAVPGTYTITYDPASHTLDVQDDYTPPTVPAEGIGAIYTNQANSPTILSDIVDNGDGSYTFDVVLFQWRYVTIYWNGVAVDASLAEISGDFGNYEPSNKALYMDLENNDATQLFCDYLAGEGTKYTITYNPTANTINIKAEADPEPVLPEDNVVNVLSTSEASDLTVWADANTVIHNNQEGNYTYKLGTGENALYVVVDSEGKITYMVYHPYGGYGNPVEQSYVRHSSYTYENNPAFANLSTYESQWGTLAHYDLIVPEGGFAIYAQGASANELTQLILSANATTAINNNVNVDDYRLVYDATAATVTVNLAEPTPGPVDPNIPQEGIYYVYTVNQTNEDGSVVAVDTYPALTEIKDNGDGTYSWTVDLAAWKSIKFYKDGVLLAHGSTITLTGLFIPGTDCDWTDNLYNVDGDGTKWMTCTGAKYEFTYDSVAGTINVSKPEPIPAEGVYFVYTYGADAVRTFPEGNLITDNQDGSYSFVAPIAQWRYVSVYYNGEVVDLSTLTISGDGWVDGTYDASVNGSLYLPDDVIRLMRSQAGEVEYKLTYNPTAKTLVIDNTTIAEPELETTTEFEIAKTTGVAATNKEILVKGVAITNNYSVSGKLVIGESDTNPHIQFSLDDSNFNNRFLLWDNDTDGTYNAAYAFNGSHQSKSGKAAVKAGEEVTWEVVTTEKHSYFYINGQLEFVFLNFGATMFVIGGEKVAVSVTDIVTVTSEDAEGWAAVLARSEVAHWENVELTDKTAAVPGKETTSITGTTTSTNSTVIYANGVAVTNNYSVSGKLKVTKIVSNPHIQFLLANGIRFLLWDPKADGTFNGGYQFAGKHINELKNLQFAVDEEITWEVLTTERHSYFFVNGELKMVYTDLNAKSLSIGGNKTEVSFYDIKTVSKAFNPEEWATVLNRIPVQHYEATEVAESNIVVFDKTMINTTGMEIANVVGVGNTVQQVIANSEYISNNYSVSGKLVIGETGNNPHIQFSLDDTNFQNRFLLWDNDTNGTFNAAYAFQGSHKAGSGKAVIKAGEEVTWEVVTTEKHSYFYINGELEFVFLNFGATKLLIGAEKTQVTITDIATVTSADAEGWAKVLAREEIAQYEASTETAAKAVVYVKPTTPDVEPVTTTGFEIAKTAGVAATNNEILVKGVAITNNYSVSGKLVIGESDTNPHIQFSLDDTNFQNRFLLWDNDTNGTFVAAYAFQGSHKAGSGNASVKAGEEVTWEVVTTEKHSYFYVNGQLEFVFLNFGAKQLLIGAEKTQVSVTDIVTVTSADSEGWAKVLAREEIAQYEASTETELKAVVA